jgi:hypothetical protein
MSFRDRQWELDDMVQRIQALVFPPEIGRMIALNLETYTLSVTITRTDRPSESVVLCFVEPAPDGQLAAIIAYGMEALYDDGELCEPKTGVIDTSHMGTDV